MGGVKNFISKLNKQEQSLVHDKKLDSVEDIVELLLNRVSPDNVSEIIELLKESIKPSICLKEDKEIAALFLKLEENPELIFDTTIQQMIAEFILQRFEKDKKIVIEKTNDIYKFITLMGQYLNDAINSSGSGSKTILGIKEKIQNVDVGSQSIEELTQLQKELVSAASLIEDEISQVNTKLKSGKSKVEELEEKVKVLEEELSKSKKESMTDHLTGVLTRRAYEEEIKRLESSYERYDTQFALIFFDLDHFKKINDTHGHDCGDVVLSTFAKILKKSTRDHDIVGRYGGEEFVAVVHFQEKEELIKYLSRIKSIVDQNAFLYKTKKIKVSFSAGVVERRNHTSYESAIQKADMLLYEAKENGRNQVRLEGGEVI